MRYDTTVSMAPKYTYVVVNSWHVITLGATIFRPAIRFYYVITIRTTI